MSEMADTVPWQSSPLAIISNTPYNDVHLWGERPKFLENHVLFDYDEDYVKTLFG